MSLAGRNRRPITAAAQRVGFSREAADRLRDQPWQDRAWQVYEVEGSIYFMTRYRSAVARKIDYFAGVVQSPGDDPNRDATYNDEGDLLSLGQGAKVLEAEGGPELVRRIVSELMVHWDVAGEAFLVRFDEDPLWRVLSTKELKKQKGGGFTWDSAPSDMGGIDSENVYRVWKPHPRLHWEADSPTKHVLEDAEELILLRRELKARSNSRMPAGILFLPDTLEMTPFGEDEEGTEDDVARWLTNAMSDAVKDPGSTRSLAPLIMTMGRDDIAAVRWQTFERDWDVNLGHRDALLRSIATGLDVPPEILTGMADLNHWSAWLVSEQAVSQHVAPTVDDILDSLTVNWYRPLLEASGVDPDPHVLWRDLSPATVPPDQSDVAAVAFRDGVISDAAYRRVINMDEEDAPEAIEGSAMMDADELLKRINALGTLRRAGADWESANAAVGLPPIELIPGLLPITVRAEGVVTNEEAVVSAVDPAIIAAVLQALKEGGPPLASAAVTAATRRRIVATELADIDAEILAWVVAEADLEIDRLLKKVGIQAATDPLDESLLAQFRQRVEAQIAKAQERARGWVEGLTGRRVPDEGESEARSAGLQVILAGVLEAVRRRLFTPQGGPDPIDTGKIADILPPTTAIREGLSLAGGGPAVYEDGHTSELIGNGQHIQDELRQDGFVPELMVWRTGAPSHPFDPHKFLNGTEFDSWESPKVAITLDGQWIGGSHYRPGDHKGCQCTVEQVLFEREFSGVADPDRQAAVRKALARAREEEGLTEPREPKPLPRRERSETFRQAGQRLIDATPKKHQRLFTEALESVEQTLSELPIPVQGRFIDMMDRMEKFKVTTVSGWRNGLVQGQFGTVGRTMPGRYPELLLETRRFDEDWIRWHVSKSEGPEPSQWRTARPDEVASTLVHELTHAHDYWDKIDAVLEQRAMPLRRAFWEESRMDVRFKLLSGGNPEYAYGATEASEGLAEATRMYVYGEEGRPTAAGFVGKTTGAEWRSLNPEMARFVEQVIWGME